ncbi:MAG: RHS repeat-associated core domain-containing protein, partial [Clostridiales bacterium]|nr:RHS repeat-associated core domain-containing protein [Clostridiales bacterium]
MSNGLRRRYDKNPYRYCGEYLDIETGYIYLRARYYDPSIGRFISEDSAHDGYNWYAYCANNPISYIDPSGMFFISTTALLIIGAAALLGTIGGIIGNHIANEKGATGWEKVGYIFGGVVIGATIGVVAGLIAAPAVISATGIAGISVTAAGITAVTTSAGLVIPEYVN